MHDEKNTIIIVYIVYINMVTYLNFQ